MTAPARSRMQGLLFAAASLLIAGVTAFFIHRVLTGYETQLIEARQAPVTIQVVSASTAIPAGAAITAESVGLTTVLPDAVEEETVFTDIAEVIGKAPRERILPGEIIRRERLEGVGQAAALQSIIANGNRALAIRAETAAVVAGLLRPGDTVDVIVTIRPDTNALGADWVTETILQAVRVLAVGSTVIGTEDGDDEPTDTTRKRTEVVTLEVSPEEAEKLALATARGELHLSLRSGEDQELLLNRGPLVTNALVGLAPRATKPTRRAPPKAAPVEARRESAEVIEGTKTKVQEFDDEGRKVENGGRSR